MRHLFERQEMRKILAVDDQHEEHRGRGGGNDCGTLQLFEVQPALRKSQNDDVDDTQRAYFGRRKNTRVNRSNDDTGQKNDAKGTDRDFHAFAHRHMVRNFHLRP